MNAMLDHLLAQEFKRQNNTLSLIASENYIPSYIARYSADHLNNKYAEGAPGARFYAGCEIVDQIERYAQSQACSLFSMPYANVQPHSGSQANYAVYCALLRPGDTILSLNLAAGGHITHGHKKSLTAQTYTIAHYSLDPETERINYDHVYTLATRHKPKLIIAGTSAYSRIIDFSQFGEIAASVGAFLMADIAHVAGLIATGMHPSPANHADVITSTTHKTLRGPRGGLILSTSELRKQLELGVMPGTQGGPFMQNIAAKAACFAYAHTPDFKRYQQLVVANAQTLAAELENRGYRIVSGGTDTHLFVLDLRNKRITGKEAEERLAAAGITTSRSCIPFDTAGPFITSGLRLGTPAVTTRGLMPEHMKTLAECIDHCIITRQPHQEYKDKIQELCTDFPVPYDTNEQYRYSRTGWDFQARFGYTL